MKKIIVSELVTLDGVIEAPGGEPGHPHTAALRRTLPDSVGPAATQLGGSLAGNDPYLPSRRDQPCGWEGSKGSS